MTGEQEISMQEVYKQSSVKRAPLGSKGVIGRRIFRYGKAGAANLAHGKLVVNADLVANHTNIVVQAAAVVGAKTVKATLGATAATEDQYAGGTLVVNDAAGEGYGYRIKGNSAADSAGVITVFLADGLVVALTTSSEVTLKLSTFAGLVISATDQADQAVGVPRIDVTAAYYAWFQTGGECPVLADEAVTKGLALTIGTGTAGAVEALDAAGEHQIGVASEALVDTEYRSVFLQLEG